MNAKNLNLRQLRAFVAVALSGSFTEAARNQHVSQSALSVMVRDLEAEVGLKLFDRSTRRVLLTEAGAEFLPAVERVLDDLASAVFNLSDLRERRRGVLRLAAPQLMASTLVPQLIASWRKDNPHVDVKLRDTLPETLMETLLKGAVELAIGPDRPDAAGTSSEEIRTIPIFGDRHWLICPPDHPLAGRKQVAWDDLINWPFIAPTQDFARRIVPELAGGAAVHVANAHAVSYITTAIGLVSAGLGLTVCPGYAAPFARASNLRVVALVRPSFYRQVCVYHLAGRTLSPVASSFLETASVEALSLEKQRSHAR